MPNRYQGLPNSPQFATQPVSSAASAREVTVGGRRQTRHSTELYLAPVWGRPAPVRHLQQGESGHNSSCCALLHSVLVKLPLCQLVDCAETSSRQLQLSEFRVGRALLVRSGLCIDQWGLAGHPAPGGPRPLTDHQLHFYIFRQCRFSPSPHFHPVSYPSPGTKPQFPTTSDQHCIASCPHRPKSACRKLTI